MSTYGAVRWRRAAPLLLLAFVQCTPGETQAQADLNAQELACVEVSATREASRDCRNAVRAAWAKTYGVDAGRLEGGSE